MRTLTNARTLITGAASGIGRAIAAAFAARGADLLLTDLDESALRQTAATLRATGARVRTWRLDVTDTPAIATLRTAIHEEGGPIDVLVNNAGVVFGGAFADVPLARHVATYRINIEAVVAMTHAFLPDLLARPDAHLVNVASASAVIPLPMGTTYASSKWAVLGFSESLALELEQTGHRHVHLTALCPSYVATGMFDGVRPPLGTRLLTPDRVADLTVRAVLANRLHVFTPWLVRVTPVLRGILPHRVFVRMAGLLGANTSMRHWRGRANA